MNIYRKQDAQKTTRNFKSLNIKLEIHSKWISSHLSRIAQSSNWNWNNDLNFSFHFYVNSCDDDHCLRLRLDPENRTPRT